MLSNELPSKDFENPPYSGVKLQAKWNSVTGSEVKDQMPKYGYFETKLKVWALHKIMNRCLRRCPGREHLASHDRSSDRSSRSCMQNPSGT